MDVGGAAAVARNRTLGPQVVRLMERTKSHRHVRLTGRSTLTQTHYSLQNSLARPPTAMQTGQAARDAHWRQIENHLGGGSLS
jgi:hypothetical protein